MAYNEFTDKILWVGWERARGANALLCLLLDSAWAAEDWDQSPTRRALPQGWGQTGSLNCQQMNVMSRSVINSHLWCSSIINVSSKRPFREKISPPKSSLETCSLVHSCHLTDRNKQALAGFSEYNKDISITRTTKTRCFCHRHFSVLRNTDLLK